MNWINKYYATNVRWDGNNVDTERSEFVNVGVTGAETYLEFRKIWKTEYAELSSSIRKAKAERRIGTLDERSAAQYRCWSLARQAKVMLWVLSMAKRDAGQRMSLKKAG